MNVLERWNSVSQSNTKSNSGDSLLKNSKMAGFEDNLDSHTRKKKVFYESSADATFHFKSGNTISVNKAILAFQSNYFARVFFGLQPEKDVNIDDFDSESFETFLNCLLGLKPYTVIDALLIYPIAHKYQVEESLEKCMTILKPTEMNENVLLTLNLALFYECKELIDSVINFLKEEVNIIQLLEKEEFNQLLTPAAILELMNHVQMDSYLWEKIYKWGKNYLKKHNKNMSVRQFFDENEILAKLSLEDFESGQAVLYFHEIITKEKLFDSDEIFIHIKHNFLEKRGKVPDKSAWVFVKAGESLEETITFQKPLCLTNETHPNGMTLLLWRNEIICYAHPKYNGETDYQTVEYTVKYNITDWYHSSYAQELSANTENEIELGKKSKSNFCTISVQTPSSVTTVDSIVCSYHFHFDCRILKTSFKEPLSSATDDKNLYFTSDIEFE